MAMEDAAGAPATQAELNVMQNDLTLLRTELRAGFELLLSEVKNTKHDLAMEIIKTNARIDGFQDQISAMSSTMLGRIDGFMANVGKTDRAQVIADWRMTELEKRVAAIESRPS